MKNDKIITHVELSVNPEFIEEVISNAIKTKDLIVLEEGTEIFKLTQKKRKTKYACDFCHIYIKRIVRVAFGTSLCKRLF